MTGMKKFILLYIILFLIFSGCEKVIDVDLNEASPAMVIEGNLSFNDKFIDVRISRTGSYFSSDTTKGLTGAGVFLEIPSGRVIKVNEICPGFYKADLANLNFNKEYRLKAEIGGKTYNAVSTLHPVVKIDSLGYSYLAGTRFYNDGYRLNIYFTDPEGVENYYRIKVYRNGILQNSIDDLIVFRDNDIDGSNLRIRIRARNFNAGDTAKIDFISIDESAWRYFTTFKDIADANPGSPAPANPVSNFDNKALGYFSAWSHDSKTVIIRK
jgi:hypothetical protein